MFNEKFMKMENGKKPACLVCGEKKGVCLQVNNFNFILIKFAFSVNFQKMIMS